MTRDLLRWHRCSDTEGKSWWEAGAYNCVQRGDLWVALGPNGVELGRYHKLNTPGGAKWACLIHARKAVSA